MIGDLLFLLLVGREFDCLLQGAWDSFHHESQLLRLYLSFRLNQRGRIDHEVNNLLGLLVCLEVGVNLVSLLVISHCLIVAFKVLENGGTVVIEVRVRILLKSLCLGVGLECERQLTDAFVVDKEISEMGIAEDVPRLRITKIKCYSFIGKLDR
jgi:hypothetical protein